MNKFKLYMLGLGLVSWMWNLKQNQRQTISIVLRVMHGVH